MATIAYKIFEKKFKGETSKQAYLEACKWTAAKIIKNEEFTKILTYRFVKVESKIPTIKLEVFLNVEEEKTKDMFCKNCKHLYNIFYQIDKINCNECKARAYRKSVEEYCKGLVEIYKNIFENFENDGGENER